ncbi:hypothetical protein chiPu_0019457 [Chiloscyllium punctatum]|uniref:Uncharacterized protein n=1 Tax=Chiloscyllium punctatum TaxID=137246 RepID=A0A401RRX3_CHIPU|nr:hypothetical protein [Chiloscyllium punctatum]
MLPGDLLVFANHKRTFANQDRFGKEEESSDKLDSRNYRDNRLINHIEIFGTVWKGDRARRLKSVTFDLPGFADQKLTHCPEAGFKREGGGAGGAVTLKHLVKGGKSKVKEKSLLRSFPSQVQSSESRKRLGMTLFSIDSKAVSHRPSVNVWMVKFILHPTKLAKVHPDEAARVKGLLRMKKQRTTKKTEWKETCKKGNSTRKAPICQSTGTTVDSQQARLPKTPKQCPLMPSQQKAFCPAHPSTGPGMKDRDQGGHESSIPGLEITSRVLLPIPPVTDTKNHKRPQSTKTPGAQRPGRSVGTVQTPNKQETTLPAKTHKAPRLVTSSSDRPPSTVFQVSVEDNEDRETLGRLISPNALTCPLQGPSGDSNHKDVEIPGAPPKGQALGMKPSEDEGANTSSRRQETTETFGWEKDHQPPPCGQSRDQDVTAKGQCPRRNPWSTVEMAEDKMGGQGKAGDDNSPSKSTSSISAASSGLGQEQGPPAAAVFSEEAVPHDEGESSEIGAAKSAAEVNQQLHPTEQPPSLTTSSTATGLRIQDHVHGGNVMAESQNRHGTNTSPTSWGANGSEEQDSNVLIFGYKNPDEGTTIREQGPRESSLLPTDNPVPLDGAGSEALQRRKIRLVIPERPSSGSNNTISRKIR